MIQLLWTLIVVFGSIVIVSVADQKPDKVRRYDCSIAEISPDYPVPVKEGCRKLKLEKKND
jgi:hypothetical protein